MKKLLMFIPLVFLLCFTFGCQQGEEVAELEPLAAEDVAANRAVTDAFNQGATSGDWAIVTALYTEDAIIMPANQSLIKGREAIQARHEAGPTIKDFSLTVEDVFGRGDIAVVRGTYSMTIAPEGVPEPIKDTGKYIEIRQKQKDGSWLIAIDIFNSDLPFPSPQKEE